MHWQTNYFLAQEIAKMAVGETQIVDEERQTEAATNPSLVKTVISQIRARLDSTAAAQDESLPLDLECA